MPSSKIISFAVPCYNSESYMDHCIETLLSAGAEDIEILIVNDGSRDNTAAKADEWEARHPGIIRAIHQENKGHGGACMAGLREARGTFFKTVDSDDWVDTEALSQLLTELRKPGAEAIDLFITNYVIENEWEHQQISVNYRTTFKHCQGRLVGWQDLGTLPIWQNITMHAMTFRRELLTGIGLELPEHTYYVDTIYTYVPLPHVKGLMYLDLDLYRYFVGRADQSTNVQNIIKRIDEHLKVTKLIIDAYELERDVTSSRLRTLMRNQLTVLMGACTAYLLLSNETSAHQKRMDIWFYLQAHDPETYKKIRWTFLCAGSRYPGTFGNFLFKVGFRICRKLFKFT